MLNQKIGQLKYDFINKNILVNEEQRSGNYELHFDANNLTSGVYFYKIRTSDLSSNQGNYIPK